MGLSPSLLDSYWGKEGVLFFLNFSGIGFWKSGEFSPLVPFLADIKGIKEGPDEIGFRDKRGADWKTAVR